MTPQRTTLYPEISPYRQDMLDVGDGHQIYWEAYGNRNGVPVIFLHGGPGAGSAAVPDGHVRMAAPTQTPPSIWLLISKSCALI